jgi:hypothetical protein
MIYLMAGIYESAVSGTTLPAYSVGLTLVVTGAAVMGLVSYLLGFSRQMRAEATR